MDEPRSALNDGAPAPQFTLQTLWRVLLERAWIILGVFVVVVFLTGAYLNWAPRIFAGTTVLQVEQMEQRIMKIETVRPEDLRLPEILKTIEQSLMSRSLLERVMDTNQLVADPRLRDPKTGEAPDREGVLLMLSRSVSARLRRGTRLIDVNVSHTNPEITAQIANSLVREYIRQTVEQQAASTQVANEFLKDEASRLRRKLQDSENALQAYKENSKSASLEDRQNIVVQRLKEVSMNVTEAKSTRLKLESEWEQMKGVGTNLAGLLVIPAVANDPGVAAVQLQLSKLEAEFANLKQRYKQKHPKYIQAQSEMGDWQRSFEKAVLKVSETTRLAYQNAQAGEKALENALREQETAALVLNKQEIQYNVLAREVASDRALYETVFQRMNETIIAKNLEPNIIRIIQSAYVPTKPVKPQRTMILALGLMAGLFGGVALALLLNALDSSLKTVDQAEEYLGLPVLSVVPQMKNLKPGKGTLIVSEASKSSGAESFRSLRTALSMLGREEARRVFLFTSALPQEGKTFSSLNYAACLAQAGFRTLLIDCDLRRPTVEATLTGQRSDKPGVTDLLTGKSEFKATIQESSLKDFCFLSAGTMAPNPAELLAQGGFDAIVDGALKEFDRVVIDSAPIHAVSDTLMVLERVQTVCLVAHAFRTSRKSILRAVQVLLNAKAPLAGVILNRMPRRRGLEYGYSDYYDYSYRDKYAEKGVYGA